MVEAWYAISVFMLTVFMVTEGWDFGAGLIHFVVGRTEQDRGCSISAIGPLWIWHEVWLVGFGGVTVAAFPAVTASAFAGFYLAFFLLLWCLIARGIAIEVRNHLKSALWREAWDFAYASASLLLALLVGVALGNVVRGVPLNSDGTFTLAFFTNFKTTGHVGILDWYTLSTGAFVMVLFAAHGASYLTMKTSEGDLHGRCETLAKRLWPIVGIMLLAVSAETWFVRASLFEGLIGRPLGWVAIAGIVGGGLGALVLQIRKREQSAFAASCILNTSLMVAGAVGVFPVMLHSTLNPDDSVTAFKGAADLVGLKLALMWWPIAAILAVAYFLFIRRNYRGRAASVKVPEVNESFGR